MRDHNRPSFFFLSAGAAGPTQAFPMTLCTSPVYICSLTAHIYTIGTLYISPIKMSTLRHSRVCVCVAPQHTKYNIHVYRCAHTSHSARDIAIIFLLSIENHPSLSLCRFATFIYYIRLCACCI